MSLEAQQKILGLAYEQWFKNYLVGLSVQCLASRLGIGQNDVTKYVEILQNKTLIQKNNIGWYIITVYGIDIYEENLAPSLISHKKQDRRMILETLLPLYNIDIRHSMNNDELANVIRINDLYYLLAVVVYLEKKGLVHLEKIIGGKFYIRLSAGGFQSLQDLTTDNAVVMGAAYKILFSVENRFRQFIESRMRSKHGSEWWNKFVSDGIKKKVDQMRQDELSLGWKVATTNGNTEYLLFEHLEKIILTNWKDVFELLFQDQQKIILRLRALESIRNSIAHSRMLSDDGIRRLEQYSQDLLNMMSVHPN